MTSLSKNVYIHNNGTIEMKPVNVKSSTYIDFNIENNDKNPKFMVGDHVRISKYKNILQKFAFQIGLKKVL